MNELPPWLLKALYKFANMPSAQVCRHYVALTILDELETEHPEIGKDSVFCDLVKAFCKSSAGDDDVNCLCSKALAKERL